MAKTYREVLLGASSFLEQLGMDGYDIQYVFLARKNWSKTDWLVKMNQPISEVEVAEIQADLALLAQHHPPQYLLGFEEFYGRRFKVTPATLIPRPETEELVAWCLLNQDQSAADLQVVDVGTGTGAIALTLKLERPTWQVSAVDLSEAALAIAKENSQVLAADVSFYHGDTLAPIDFPIDILISNPPYISETEWSLMDESVRSFEPKLALFAEKQGLAMYEKLAEEAKEKLAVNGQIFLEIGFQQAEAVRHMFQEAFPEKQVNVRKDLSGNDRMVHVH